MSNGPPQLANVAVGKATTTQGHPSVSTIRERRRQRLVQVWLTTSTTVSAITNLTEVQPLVRTYKKNFKDEVRVCSGQKKARLSANITRNQGTKNKDAESCKRYIDAGTYDDTRAALKDNEERLHVL